MFGARHCIPPIVRLLLLDYEQKIIIKCLECIQLLCLLPSYRPCRRNQTIFQKANGFNQILTLIRRSNRENFLQAKAIATFAFTIFGRILSAFIFITIIVCFSFVIGHKENKEILTAAVIRQLFKRIASLLNSADENVQIEAGVAYD